MDCLFGITGKDFVLLATDRNVARSIVVMKSNQPKICTLNPRNVLAFSGEPGDNVQFAEYIQRNVALYDIRHADTTFIFGEDISSTASTKGTINTSAAANFTRKILADSLRSRKPYQVNVLLGGLEPDKSGNSLVPSLYWINFIASMIKVPYACHGYGSYFCLSLLDKHYRDGMNKDEVLNLLKLCLEELKQRFLINLPSFAVRIITPGGIEEIDDMRV